jgi:hypothetical protein
MAVLLGVGLGVGVRAQRSPAPTATATTWSEEEDLSNQSTPQLVERAVALVRKMEEQLTDSFYLLEASLAAGDVNGANSRNEAITVMKGLVKLSEQNLMSMRQKAAEGDRKRVENEYVKILIASQKVSEYYAQVKSAVSLGVGVLELSSVERRLVFSGSLPVVDELPQLYTSFDVFDPVVGETSDPVLQPSYYY